MSRNHAFSLAPVWRMLRVMLVSSVVVGAAREIAQAAPKNLAATDTATVSRVLDGDTFVLNGDRHIRLIGVDTPEKGEPFADVARAFADSLLRGKAVRIELDRLSEDRYGRLLAYVYLDTVFVNELLIRDGLARVYLFKENRRYAGRFIVAQKGARTEKVGIWSLPPPSPEPYYISAGGSFRFHRPLCPLAKNINLRKAKRYKTRDAALDEGLSPCRQCRP